MPNTISSGSSLYTSIVNAPTGLTGTIGYRILDSLGATVVARTTSGITESPAGSGHYRVVTPPLLLPIGDYSVLWDTDPGGVANPSNSADEDFSVIDATSVDVGPVPLGEGLCQLWVMPDAVQAAIIAAGNADPGITRATELATAATSILYELSGENYPGICTSTVTPIPACYPYRSGLSHRGRFGIPLDGSPIVAIDEVLVDGNIQNPTTYYEDRGVLYGVEMREGVEITYRYGQGPPQAGVDAALAFALELYNAGVAGGNCALPDSVTQIARDGITYTKPAIQELRTLGMTGIGAVDLFLRAYNPNALTMPPMIMTPGSRRTRRIA